MEEKSIGRAAESRQTLAGIAGLMLLLMGLASYGLIYTRDDVSMAVHLAGGAGVLTALGVSTILINVIGKLERRIKALEDRAD